MAFRGRSARMLNLLKEQKKIDINEIYTKPLNLNINKEIDYIPDSFENSSDDKTMFRQTLGKKIKNTLEKENKKKEIEESKKVVGENETEPTTSYEQHNDEASLESMSLLCEEIINFSDEDGADKRENISDRFINMFNDSDNSRDKDYIPDSFENSSDDENPLIISKQTLVQKQKNTQERGKNKEELGEMNKNQDIAGSGQNEVTPGQDEVDPTVTQIINQELQFGQEFVPVENATISVFRPMPEQDLEKEEKAQTTNQSVSPNENEKGVTKAGNARKRRKFEEPLKERQEKKKKQNYEKLSLKEPCTLSCKKKCTTKITEAQRKELHDQYVNLNWEERGLFIKCSVDECLVNRRIQSTDKVKNRTVTYRYFIKLKEFERTEVCKTYFLTTLGYNRFNDSRVMTALKQPIDGQKIKRGRYERTNKIDKDVIKKHIMTYDPKISHYRREHAPNRLYLPSDITVTMMHEQFCTSNPDVSVSLEFYRKVVKNDMNISFAHLGNEECETCALFQKHDVDHIKNMQVESCTICKEHVIHKGNYRETRKAYKNDVELASESTDKDIVYFSVDLQKVVMLPRIEQYKSAIFCTRIVAYNESFVPLGASRNANIPFAALWNETISGRDKEDIISTFRAFLISKRDVEHFVLWLDNCASQNKNWALFSFLTEVVNSALISAKTITLKYLDSGHTFMSADSFHHQVEQQLKKMNKVYDFADYIECVRLANSKKNCVKVMEVSDFYLYKDWSSQHKLRKYEPRIYLKDIAVVKAERGLFTLKYKSRHSDNDYSILDFLQTKLIKANHFPEAVRKERERGITNERKAEIITKLVPLMPENRRNFWNSLPVASQPVTDD